MQTAQPCQDAQPQLFFLYYLNSSIPAYISRACFSTFPICYPAPQLFSQYSKLKDTHTRTLISLKTDRIQHWFSLASWKKRAKDRKNILYKLTSLPLVQSTAETAKEHWICGKTIPTYSCQGQSALCTGLASQTYISNGHRQSALNLAPTSPPCPNVKGKKHIKLVLP